MPPKTDNFIHQHALAILLLLLYVTEGYFKVLDFSFGEESLILRITKLTIVSAFGLFILFKKPKTLLVPLLLTFSFCIGQVFLNKPFQKEVLVTFGKFLFPVLLFIFFDAYGLSKNQRDKLYMAFEWIVIFNSLLILLGFCFEIYQFKTYDSVRFGYDGLLVTSATGSYFYIIALISLFFKYSENLFKKPSNLLIILSALLVGTKAIYIFIIGFLGIFLFRFIKKNKKIIITGFAIIALVMGYFFFFVYGLFNEIRQTDGFFSALLSYRDQLLFQKTLPFINENWKFMNYLLGGLEDTTTRSQIDIIDIFYFFGLIGGLLYLWIYFKLFFPVKGGYSIKFLLGLMFFIVCFGGNFFSYASVAIYVVILREFLRDSEIS